MFVKLTGSSTGKAIAVREEAIESFADSMGYTVIKVSGKVFEVRETVEEICAQLAEASK